MDRLDLVANCLSGKKTYVYSVPVGPKRPNESRIYRHPQAAESMLQIPTNVKSVGSFWVNSVARFPNKAVFESIPYSVADEIVTKLGSWMFKNSHKVFYLYLKNCPEWTLTDVAGIMYGCVSVPLYDTLGPDSFSSILGLTEGTMILANRQTAQMLLDGLKKNKYSIKTVVFTTMPDQMIIQGLTELGIKVHGFKDLTEASDKFPLTVPRPTVKLDDPLSYVFTSGTTGVPKGVITTHRCAVSQILGLKGHFDIEQNDVHISFLPIAHTFERYVTWSMIEVGATIKYTVLPTTEVVKEFMRIQPTFTPMVPRLLNKLYAVARNMKIPTDPKQPNPVKQLFGGRLRLMVTGSAPISPQILSFFSKNLNCDVREGYGQTETTAASFVTYSGDEDYGHVGGPNRSLEFKLVDVPEMNYLSTDPQPRGEVCMRGDSVFKGYYKNLKATTDTVDEEGWNHSGDIGIILPNGALKIIDRKKNIYKLSQGEYIAPEKLENIYMRCPVVAECFVYGDSMKDFNVAVVHPNMEVVQKLASAKLGLTQQDSVKLCANPKVVELVLDQMTALGKQQKLNGFQIAKKLYLTPQSMTLSGIFTSSMKLQRHTAKQVFAKQIDQMYASK